MPKHYGSVNTTIYCLREYSALSLRPKQDTSALQRAVQIHASPLIRLEKQRRGRVWCVPFPSAPSHKVKMSCII